MFNRRWLITITVAAVVLAGFAISGIAKEGEVKREYAAEFTALNDSGVSGSVELWLEGKWLKVSIDVEGLEAGVAHPLYINGFDDPEAVTLCPHAGADIDGDGIISLEEASSYHGRQLFAIEPFDKVDDEGELEFEAKFEIDPKVIEPLELRSIVLHGLTVNENYDETIPIACGRITIVE